MTSSSDLQQPPHHQAIMNALDAAQMIRVKSVLVFDGDRRILTVRKRGSQYYQLPGGKPEKEESACQTVVREVVEELGVTIDPDDLDYLGAFLGAAVNEAGCPVESEVFVMRVDGDFSVYPHAEIEEVRWWNVEEALECAQISAQIRTQFLPKLAGKKRYSFFLGASPGSVTELPDQVYQLGNRLARDGHALIYGGGKTGLMGRISDGFYNCGGRVTGVTIRKLVEREIANPDVSVLVVAESMAQRKRMLMRYAEVIVVLPGGIGTLDEFYEAWALKYLGCIDAELVLVNVNGFWDTLLKLIDVQMQCGFISRKKREMVRIVDDIDDL
ncbi:MAG: TIGR00730 family Rossman fold protein [Actinomycetaceae bacterium]|nr:TIGR00730 family Rossman fold protein [Actinomycetaceae bacterium]